MDCKATLHLSFCVYRSVESMNFTPLGNIGTLFPYTCWECWNPFPNDVGALFQYTHGQHWNPVSPMLEPYFHAPWTIVELYSHIHVPTGNVGHLTCISNAGTLSQCWNPVLAMLEPFVSNAGTLY